MRITNELVPILIKNKLVFETLTKSMKAVWRPNGVYVVYSYRTPILTIYKNGSIYFDIRKFSRTTAKHQRLIAEGIGIKIPDFRPLPMYIFENHNGDKTIAYTTSKRVIWEYNYPSQDSAWELRLYHLDGYHAPYDADDFQKVYGY